MDRERKRYDYVIDFGKVYALIKLIIFIAIAVLIQWNNKLENNHFVLMQYCAIPMIVTRIATTETAPLPSTTNKNINASYSRYLLYFSPSIQMTAEVTLPPLVLY